MTVVFLFCTKNPGSCPFLAVKEPGDPCSIELSIEADIRADLPGYRVFEV